jgi:hypothetical protein
MSLQFERGNRDAPVGHALIYFRADTGPILAAYASIPPIPFDPSKYLPGIFAGMMQGMDLSEAALVMPTPPVPEEVESVEYLHVLAEQRQDDLLYGGTVSLTNPMQLAEVLQLVAREYAEAYRAAMPAIVREVQSTVSAPDRDAAARSPFASMGEQERLKELTMLTGRLQDSLPTGVDPEVETQMRALADLLPPKYRANELLEAAHVAGDRGRKLAGLYLERAYKLYNEDYLDLERLDREIDALSE